MNVKIIFLHNPHDQDSVALREELLTRWSQHAMGAEIRAAILNGKTPGEINSIMARDAFARETELYTADFQVLKQALPVQEAPSYFICFPEVQTAADLERAIAAVKQAFKARQ